MRAGVAIATASMSLRLSSRATEVSTSTVDRLPIDLSGASFVEIADGDQIPFGVVAEIADQVRSPVAGSDHGDRRGVDMM